ncbi:GntR family transcriptional regulator [Asaia sp. As-1742]|uniref:GntR family transcriptional regulator n=1 Tax=Asaia sp. As-1742 TaxID=2608325 RepID=UPI001421E483|nr:GntR family transcriptional regulator [Asaia sp. As-1742]NIE80791.1 GntR family transcriptional regulator [Asaia sp. As-1742]
MTLAARKMQPLIVRSITDQLYGVLREQILSGALPAGQPIRQDTLAAEFNISKIPLRETLARLEQDGLVKAQPKRGYTVCELTSREAEDVFKLRLRLEPSAAAEAALLATAADQKTAQKALKELETAAKQHRTDLSNFNRVFHLSLVRPGAGRLTLHVIETLSVIAERYVRFHLHPLGRDTRANTEHREILAAWLERDALTVETLLVEHLQDTLEDLRSELDIKQPVKATLQPEA